MFKAIDVLDPAFIEQPLTALWQHISPLYAADEDQVLARPDAPGPAPGR